MVGLPIGVVLGLLPIGTGTFQKLWLFPAVWLGLLLGMGGEIRTLRWHPKRALWDLVEAMAMGIGGALVGGGLGLLGGGGNAWRYWLVLGMAGASARVPQITPGRGGALWGHTGNVMAWAALWALSGALGLSIAIGVALGILLELACRMGLPLVGIYLMEKPVRPAQAIRAAVGRGYSEALIASVGIGGILGGAFLCRKLGVDPLLVGGGAGLWWINTTLRRHELLRWLRISRPWVEGWVLLVLGALLVRRVSPETLMWGGIIGIGLCAGRVGGGALADFLFPFRVHPKLWLRRIPQGPLALALAYQGDARGEVLWGVVFAAGISLAFLFYRRGRFGTEVKQKKSVG